MSTSPFPVLLYGGLANLREVGPGLFVGGAFAVTKRSFGVILDLDGFSLKFPEYYEKSVLITEPIRDDFPIRPEVLDRILGRVFADKKALTSDVLIHCSAGMSRSPSIAYLLLRCGWRGDPLPKEEVLRRVRAENSIDSPSRILIESIDRYMEERVEFQECVDETLSPHGD